MKKLKSQQSRICHCTVTKSGSDQRQAAFDIVGKLCADDDIIDAGDVVHAKRRVAAVARDQVGEGILHAGGLRRGSQPCAVS